MSFVAEVFKYIIKPISEPRTKKEHLFVITVSSISLFLMLLSAFSSHWVREVFVFV